MLGKLTEKSLQYNIAQIEVKHLSLGHADFFGRSLEVAFLGIIGVL